MWERNGELGPGSAVWTDVVAPDQCARRLCKAERIRVGEIEDAVNGGRG